VAVEFAVSADGKECEVAPAVTPGPAPRLAEIAGREFDAPLDGKKVRFLRVKAKNVGLVPDWHTGSGGKAWPFVDEIVIQWRRSVPRAGL
jgi:hexosaminidase